MCSLTSIQKSNFTFNAHLNSLQGSQKTNHENKVAKMNNQTKSTTIDLHQTIFTKKKFQS